MCYARHKVHCSSCFTGVRLKWYLKVEYCLLYITNTDVLGTQGQICASTNMSADYVDQHNKPPLKPGQ